MMKGFVRLRNPVRTHQADINTLLEGMGYPYRAGY